MKQRQLNCFVTRDVRWALQKSVSLWAKEDKSGCPTRSKMVKNSISSKKNRASERNFNAGIYVWRNQKRFVSDWFCWMIGGERGFEPPVELPLLRFSRPSQYSYLTLTYLITWEKSSIFVRSIFRKLAYLSKSFSHHDRLFFKQNHLLYWLPTTTCAITSSWHLVVSVLNQLWDSYRFTGCHNLPSCF